MSQTAREIRGLPPEQPKPQPPPAQPQLGGYASKGDMPPAPYQAPSSYAAKAIPTSYGTVFVTPTPTVTPPITGGGYVTRGDIAPVTPKPITPTPIRKEATVTPPTPTPQPQTWTQAGYPQYEGLYTFQVPSPGYQIGSVKETAVPKPPLGETLWVSPSRTVSYSELGYPQYEGKYAPITLGKGESFTKIVETSAGLTYYTTKQVSPDKQLEVAYQQIPQQPSLFEQIMAFKVPLGISVRQPTPFETISGLISGKGIPPAQIGREYFYPGRAALVATAIAVPILAPKALVALGVAGPWWTPGGLGEAVGTPLSQAALKAATATLAGAGISTASLVKGAAISIGFSEAFNLATTGKPLTTQEALQAALIGESFTIVGAGAFSGLGATSPRATEIIAAKSVSGMLARAGILAGLGGAGGYALSGGKAEAAAYGAGYGALFSLGSDILGYTYGKTIGSRLEAYKAGAQTDINESYKAWIKELDATQANYDEIARQFSEAPWSKPLTLEQQLIMGESRATGTVSYGKITTIGDVDVFDFRTYQLGIEARPSELELWQPTLKQRFLSSELELRPPPIIEGGIISLPTAVSVTQEKVALVDGKTPAIRNLINVDLGLGDIGPLGTELTDLALAREPIFGSMKTVGETDVFEFAPKVSGGKVVEQGLTVEKITPSPETDVAWRDFLGYKTNLYIIPEDIEALAHPQPYKSTLTEPYTTPSGQTFYDTAAHIEYLSRSPEQIAMEHYSEQLANLRKIQNEIIAHNRYLGSIAGAKAGLPPSIYDESYSPPLGFDSQPTLSTVKEPWYARLTAPFLKLTGWFEPAPPKGMQPLWESIGSTPPPESPPSEIVVPTGGGETAEAVSKMTSGIPNVESALDRQIYQQVANPFTTYRGRPYYATPQADYEDVLQGIISYPASGLKQPQAPSSIVKEMQRNLGLTGLAENIAVGVSPMLDLGLSPASIVGQAQGLRLGQGQQQIQDQQQIQEQITIPVTTTTTETTPPPPAPTSQDFFGFPSFPGFKWETPSLSRPSGGKGVGLRSRKRVYPILTGTEVLLKGLKELPKQKKGKRLLDL